MTSVDLSRQMTHAVIEKIHGTTQLRYSLGDRNQGSTSLVQRQVRCRAHQYSISSQDPSCLSHSSGKGIACIPRLPCSRQVEAWVDADDF